MPDHILAQLIYKGEAYEEEAVMGKLLVAQADYEEFLPESMALDEGPFRALWQELVLKYDAFSLDPENEGLREEVYGQVMKLEEAIRAMIDKR